MKKMQLFMLLSFVLLSNVPIRAQNWGQGGNTLTAFSRLGSNNYQPLRFYTSGLERGRITPTGLWGIGTTAPNAKLHVNSVTGQNPLRVQVNGLSKLVVHSGGGVSIGSTLAGPANGLYVAGNVGVGTTAPQSVLHAVGSEVLSTGFQAGFKFRNRNSASAADDWAWYSQGNIARFWKNGTGDLLAITPTGNVGIGTTTPGSYRLKVKHGSYGLNLEQATTGNEWEIYTAPSNSLRGFSVRLLLLSLHLVFF